MKAKVELARSRSNVYGLLAGIFRKEIESDFIPHLKDPQILGVLSLFGGKLDKCLPDKPEDEIIEDLAVEYARLFIGPDSHISPHESVHAEREDDGSQGLLWGASTVEVKKFIETTGLKYRDDSTEIPDHISVELDFMRMAIEREAQAWEEGDSEGALYGLGMQKMFIDDHLVQWIPKFCDEVIALAELPFYLEIAKATKGFINFEEENIDSYISDASG